MLHGYHEYLKAIGLFEQEAKQLNPCQIEYEDPFQAISMVSIPFICQWQGCNAEFYCPNKFYRHVEEHAKDGEHSRKDKKQKGEKVKADCLWKGECLHSYLKVSNVMRCLVNTLFLIE